MGGDVKVSSATPPVWPFAWHSCIGEKCGGVALFKQPAKASMPSPSESVAPGLHGLSAVERYYFETQGFVVIPNIIPGQLLAKLNAVKQQCIPCGLAHYCRAEWCSSS